MQLSKQDTTQFIRQRVLSELCDRSILGLLVYVVLWTMLSWYYQLYNATFGILSYTIFGVLSVAFIFRAAIIFWIKKTSNNKNLYFKIQMVQASYIVNCLLWCVLFLYIISEPKLSAIHVPLSIISLCIFIINPISVSISSLLRIFVICISMIAASCAFVLSSIESKYLLSFLCFILLAYILEFSSMLHHTFWKSMISELALSNHIAEEKKLGEQLKVLSQTDGLTGLYNRMYFDQNYFKELKRAKRQNYPISILLIDIDHFKKINDTMGHKVGDYALRQFALILKNAMRRSNDIIARYGGEEFIVLMINANREEATNSARRILHHTRQQMLTTEEGLQLKLTCSIGIATTTHKNYLNSEELIHQADIALYSAKGAGRDRSAIYGRADASDTPQTSLNANAAHV